MRYTDVSYAIFTIIIAVTLGTPITYFIDQAIAGGMSIFTYHFTILPVLACIPFIIAISMIIPWIFYKTSRKMSIVERLREIA